MLGADFDFDEDADDVNNADDVVRFAHLRFARLRFAHHSLA